MMSLQLHLNSLKLRTKPREELMKAKSLSGFGGGCHTDKYQHRKNQYLSYSENARQLKFDGESPQQWSPAGEVLKPPHQ
jgi:hypothetical protein